MIHFLVNAVVVAAALALCSCAPRKALRYEYGQMDPWKLEPVSPSAAESICGPRIRCCFDHIMRVMTVAWNAVDCIVHELCHVAGGAEVACAGTHWNPHRYDLVLPAYTLPGRIVQ